MKDFKKSAPVVVNGDKVEYLQDKQRVRGTGNVKVTYGDVVLTCEEILVHTDTKLGICKGNVKIVQGKNILTGSSIEYNFANKTGKIVDGRVEAYPLYGRADNVQKISEDEVVLNKGYVTTCDLDKPHYRIEAKEVKVYLDDKVIAKHVVFYLGDLPVMYIPYYIQPIKDTKTKITVIPGYTDEWGYYALGAYRYYLSEQLKGYIRLDYRHKRGVGTGIDYNYSLKELGEGSARFYYAQENNDLALDREGHVDDRWRFQYKHDIDFSENTKGTIEINKLSDKDVVKDFFFRELDDGWSPENYFSIISRHQNYSLEVLGEKRLNDFFTVTERLPETKMRIHSQRLWDTSFYYNSDMSFANFVKRYAVSDNKADEEAVRLDTYNKLSYAAKLFNFLFATPYIATRQTFYSENRYKRRNVLREIYEYGVDFSAKFFRVFGNNIPILDINGFRHIITPTIGFRHRHQPTVSPDNLFHFDGIDSLDYENQFDLGLENKLQTKRRRGDKWESVDVARLVIRTGYPFRFNKFKDFGFQGEGDFSEITCDLEIKPYDWLFAKTNIIFDIVDYNIDNSIKSANTDLVCEFEDKFSVGLGHSYENTDNNSASQFTFETKYKINDDWSIRVYERFDSHASIWEEQEYTVTKDLHCWVADFTCNIKESDIALWVIFRIKAFPEVPIGFKRTYRRPTPGSSSWR